MTKYARVDRILHKLAQQHVPHLLAQLPTNEDSRLRYLADGLAVEGVLVLTGQYSASERPQQEQYEAAVRRWIILYGSLYDVLARRLFPSLIEVRAVFADDQQPPVVVMEGAASCVLHAMGEYIVPYVVARQNTTIVTNAELGGVMMFVLNELEASDLRRAEYDELLRVGQRLLWELLQVPIRQLALTTPAKLLFRQVNVPPPPPEMLPEDPTGTVQTPTERMFRQYIPMGPRLNATGTNRAPTHPPVPGLPRNNR